MKTAAVESPVRRPQGARSPLNGVNTRHPKAGERRHVRQPLRLHPSKPKAGLLGTPVLDRLPLALLDRIRAERANGRTWDEIERDSPQWPEWEQASPEVLAGFPDRRLPHSNVQRWHDLRVERLQREREVQATAAQAFAGQLAARPIPHLGDAACPGLPWVKNAFSESVFRLALEGGDEQHRPQPDGEPGPEQAATLE